MRAQQSGFTLVEIAIVLVIIGLLLGGILKGQELINSAKVKNLANDFRVIPTYVYAYQDKYKALPGDDVAAASHVTGATNATTPAGSRATASSTATGIRPPTDETRLFWQHVRLANLAAGPTDVTDPTYTPKNAVGGTLGISGASGALLQVAGMTGTYQVCSAGILGKFAKQLDVQMDDGNTATGSLRVVADGAALGAAALATTAVDDATSYTVCMTF
jgi:prepilin-type N-terminal cleavage/methylation domain-containing protein